MVDSKRIALTFTKWANLLHMCKQSVKLLLPTRKFSTVEPRWKSMSRRASALEFFYSVVRRGSKPLKNNKKPIEWWKRTNENRIRQKEKKAFDLSMMICGPPSRSANKIKLMEVSLSKCLKSTNKPVDWIVISWLLWKRCMQSPVRRWLRGQHWANILGAVKGDTLPGRCTTNLYQIMVN